MFAVYLTQTRVLVTHNISFLPQVDRIIVLKDGEISEVRVPWISIYLKGIQHVLYDKNTG